MFEKQHPKITLRSSQNHLLGPACFRLGKLVETAVNAVFSDKEVAARPGKEHLEILRKVHAVQFSKVDQRKFKGKIESKYGKQKNMR